MKIFISFLQSKYTHPIPAYDFWEYYIKNGITEAGHEWVECPDVDWAAGLVPQSTDELARWKEISWSKTLSWLKKNPVDLFLSYLFPKQIDEDAVLQIKQIGIPCVNFFCDNVRDFNNVPIQFKVFDSNWVPEYKAIKLYQNAGFAHINLPMPIWIQPKLRINTKETKKQITFIGSKDIQRVKLFNNLIRDNPNLPLAIYGNGWIENKITNKNTSNYTFAHQVRFNTSFLLNNGIISYTRKLVQRNQSVSIDNTLKLKINPKTSFDEYIALTTESMIVLGINRYPSFKFPLTKPDTYSRLRDIEAPMLGACYLTEWTAGIEDLYDIQTEISVYKSEPELADQIERLKQNHQLRKSLRINGQKRALSSHSIPNSLKRLFTHLNL